MTQNSDEWHSDLSYMAEPSSVSLLWGIEIPQLGELTGVQQPGDTLFVDTVASDEELESDLLRRAASMKAVHQNKGQQTEHPCVRLHPWDPKTAAVVQPTLLPLLFSCIFYSDCITQHSTAVTVQ